MNEDRLERLLAEQDTLQRAAYNLSPTEMSVEERVQYITWNVLALEDELHELLNETTWKPWAQGPPQINDELGMNELVDALHFLLNLALALSPGQTPEAVASQLYAGYLEKRGINARRQQLGYDGSTKCPGCARELDRPDSLDFIGGSISNAMMYRCAHCYVAIPSKLVAKVQS